MLVAGGRDSLFAPLASAELYDPATGIWTETDGLATKRRACTATLLTDGKVLVAGGYNGSSSLRSAELYDPVAGTWEATGLLNRGRYDHSATLLSDGRVLVAGGFGINSDLDAAEIYDPVSGTWSATGSMANARERLRRRCCSTARFWWQAVQKAAPSRTRNSMIQRAGLGRQQPRSLLQSATTRQRYCRMERFW